MKKFLLIVLLFSFDNILSSCGCSSKSSCSSSSSCNSCSSRSCSSCNASRPRPSSSSSSVAPVHHSAKPTTTVSNSVDQKLNRLKKVMLQLRLARRTNKQQAVLKHLKRFFRLLNDKKLVTILKSK